MIIIDKWKNIMGKQALLLGLASLLTACAGDMSDLDRFIAETKTKHHGQVDPLPEFPPYETFTYTADKTRDPFRPQTDESQVAAVTETSSGPRPEVSRRKEPLESYPIDSLKMVGLLQQSAQTWGLVKDPEGTIHRVQPGNFAGQNHGKIVAVAETKIDIVELVADGLSGWVQREAQLAMTED
ncbi:MAG: pilus assembly protein PilP [Gammaproteobacteria bacterium]|nr:pilus assembly protein PilP [Gammaproteobacteria bacterium]